MTRVNREQLRRFLAEAWEAVREAERIVSKDLSDFMSDTESRYALRYAIIMLVEALTDALTLILEADYGIAPESYRDAIVLAAEKHVIPHQYAEKLLALISLRHMLIHRYWRIDDARLFRETRENIVYVKKVLEVLEGYG